MKYGNNNKKEDNVKKNIKRKLPKLSVVENSDYFYRDAEMARSDMVDASDNETNDAYTDHEPIQNKNPL